MWCFRAHARRWKVGHRNWRRNGSSRSVVTVMMTRTVRRAWIGGPSTTPRSRLLSRYLWRNNIVWKCCQSKFEVNTEGSSNWTLVSRSNMGWTHCYSAQIWPVIARESHSFIWHPRTNHTYLYFPAAEHHRPLTAIQRTMLCRRWYYHKWNNLLISFHSYNNVHRVKAVLE